MRRRTTRRLFKVVSNSPRRFRHEAYAYIASKEKEAWALGFESPKETEDRNNAILDPKDPSLPKGFYPSPRLVKAWAGAFKDELGFEFDPPVRGARLGTGGKEPPRGPNGIWSTKLAFL